MTIDTETLMAYVDGELDDADAARIADAIESDPDLAARVDAMRSVGQQLRETFDTVSQEPVPDALANLVRARRGASTEPDTGDTGDDTVVAFERRRPVPAPAGGGRWMAYGAIAASLVLGLLIGGRLGGSPGSFIQMESGRPVAAGQLARALEAQPSGGQFGATGTGIQLTFRDRDGRFCRNFVQGETAGLACRTEGQWIVEMTAPVRGGPAPIVRTASSSMPVAILDAVDARIEGEAFAPEREASLLESGWETPGG